MGSGRRGGSVGLSPGASRRYGSLYAFPALPLPLNEFPEPTTSRPPTMAGLEFTDPGKVKLWSGVPVAASKAQSDGGDSVPLKTTAGEPDTADAADDAPPFCSHRTLRATGAKACIVGCCCAVLAGSL